MTYANAGHAPALIVRDGETTRLGSHRPPLGIHLESTFGDACSLDDMQSTVKLEPGDRVVFTSDGVSESMDPKKEQFGSERIEATARRADLDAHQVIELLMNQVDLHRAGRRPDDDITILCVDRVAA